MNEVLKYLQPNATVPIDMETTAMLVNALRQSIADLESQEPVALPCCGYTDASAVKWNPLNGVVQCHNCGQTYTHPPQRTWVGLTDEEIQVVAKQARSKDHAVTLTNKLLREKNAWLTDS
jgi:hypothetical protein